NKISERVIAMEDYALKSYPGNYDYYKSVQDEIKQNQIVAQEPTVQNVKPNKPGKPNEGRTKENLAVIEKEIERIEQEIRELDVAMAVEGIDYEELNKLYTKKEQLSLALELLLE